MKELLATSANYMEAINPETGKRAPQVEVSITTCEPVYRLDPGTGQVNKRIESFTIRFVAGPKELRNLAAKLTNMAEDSETMHTIEETPA